MIGDAAVNVSGAVPRVSLDRHDRPVVVTLGLESPAKGKGGVGVPRVDLKRLAIIRDSAVDLIFSLVGEAAIGVGVGVLWVDLDCLGEICDGVVMVALRLERATAVKVGIGIPRIDLDGLGIVRVARSIWPLPR